jgi:hypothetical protein
VENEIRLLTCPFSFDVIKVPDNLQMEIIDLLSHRRLTEVQFCEMCLSGGLYDFKYSIQISRLCKEDVICFCTHINYEHVSFNEVEQMRFKIRNEPQVCALQTCTLTPNNKKLVSSMTFTLTWQLLIMWGHVVA